MIDPFSRRNLLKAASTLAWPARAEAKKRVATIVTEYPVVLIGEHGDYPVTEKGQKLYPRYRLYQEIVDVFRASGREPYPPERTLLTTGALAALMDAGGRSIQTLHLAITYRAPSRSLFAGDPVPALEAKS